MITFKSHDDLQKLDQHDPAYTVMEELVKVLIDDFNEPGQTFSPEDFGFLVLIEAGDTDRELTEIDMPKFTEIYREGASMRQGFNYAVFLGTDDWGLGVVIPSELVDEVQSQMVASGKQGMVACRSRHARLCARFPRPLATGINRRIRAPHCGGRPDRPLPR